MCHRRHGSEMFPIRIDSRILSVTGTAGASVGGHMEGGATPAVAGAAGLISGVRLLLGAIGLVSTINGLINDSVVAALNTAGVIGLPALVICGWPVLSMLFKGHDAND